LDRRSEALAQLLETALSERFASPVMELLSVLPIPLAILHAGDLRIFAINAQMAALVDRPSADAVGLPISELLPAAHPLGDPRPYHESASQDQAVDRNLVLEGVVWRWFIRPLRGDDRIVQYLLVGLLDGGRGPSEGELGRLREVNAAKTEFLNLAAHELRTPLGVIHGYGSLLSQGGLTEEHQRLAGLRIYQKARQLSRLIMDLTLIGRIDELAPGLAREPVDLAGLAQETVADVQRRYPDLAIEIDARKPAAPAEGSPYWLRLAIRELLDNAVRFRPGPTGRVDVRLDGELGFCRLTVLDDGFGIDPAEHGRLWRRFSRIETDENHHLVGMGIGLYLVREVAEAHRGRVSVVSRPGVGSEFTFELPTP